MFNQLKTGLAALAAVAALTVPMMASAQTGDVVVGRIIDGEFYRLDALPPAVVATDADSTVTIAGNNAVTGNVASGVPVATITAAEPTARVASAVRNDLYENIDIEIPVTAMPPAGACRLWYPDRAIELQPAVTACGIDVPRGAILIKG